MTDRSWTVEVANPAVDELRAGRSRGLDQALVEDRPRNHPGRSGHLPVHAYVAAIEDEPPYRGPVVEDPGDADAGEQIEYVRSDPVTTGLVARELVPVE